MSRIVVILFVVFSLGCSGKKEDAYKTVETTEGISFTKTDKKNAIGLQKLSDYEFFQGKLAELKPAKNVIPYELNSPLFSDYAHKARFVKFPVGTSADYNAEEVLEFPVGTILIKNFYYPSDFRKPDGEKRIIETRLLLHKKDGWQALPYVWNDEQTEAFLQLTGATKNVSWLDEEGKQQQIAYAGPNMNQCKSCHSFNGKIKPIGPSARQLNKDYHFESGTQNQLQYLADEKYLKNLPSQNEIPKLVNYQNHAAPLDDRARAYLEINCGHCHRKEGPAKNSALELLSKVDNPAAWGVGKTPIAAGKGSGGFKYDILPGHPEQSILLYRMNSLDPGIMMPELGRKMVHKEGVALVKQWIAEMD